MQKLRFDIVNCGDFRLNITNIQPDLVKDNMTSSGSPINGKPSKKSYFKGYLTHQYMLALHVCF